MIVARRPLRKSDHISQRNSVLFGRLKNVGVNKDNSTTDHSKSAGRSGAKIKDAPVSKRATIIYRNDNAAPCFRIGYANSGTEWQRSMCRGKTAASTGVISGHPRKALTCRCMDWQRSYEQND